MRHKLFKKYYPIQTEEQKEAFLEDHKDSVLKFLKGELLRCRTMHFDAFNDYKKHLKNTVGFLGKIKWKAVAKNINLTRRFERVSWSIDRYQSSYEALKTDVEDNTVSVDDINYILIKMNNRFNAAIAKTVFFVVFVLILVAICKFAL